MTKKHFEAIAKAIRKADLSETETLVVASALAAELVRFNDKFEAGRFIRACLGAAE